MTWSFQVSQGDLVLSGDGFSTVSNENKLVQDLRHYLLERMGTDTDNPTYGSLLDGGTLSTGEEVPSVIARTDWGYIQMDIEAEIRRIAALYQNAQVNRAQSDRQRYGKSTLTTGEILVAVKNISFAQTADSLLVNISIVTGNNKDADLSLILPAVITF